MDLNYFKNKFDWKGYISRYPDLHKATCLNDAWNHVNNFGWKENRTIFADDNIQKAFVSFKNTGVMPVKELDFIKNLLSQKDKKILVNTHSNLNIVAGDTIMISNIMNIMMKNGNHITLLTEFDCVDVLKKNLEMTQYTIVKQNSNELISYMDTNYSKFDTIFVRNHNILTGLVNKSYLNKTILYGLDLHLESIVKMNNQFRSLVTQSEQLKNLYIKKGILEKKIEILEPISMKYDFKLPKRNDNEIRMIYCGTLRDEENILEIIEEFQKIHKERPEVVLKIVYGKVHGDASFTKKVNEYIKNGVNGITFKYNLSHKDACYEIATSDIGICWRKNGWGDNGEVSTKVKEYKLYGLKLCNSYAELISVLKLTVSIICCTKRPSFHYNILQSVKNLQGTSFDIKLLVCLNNIELDVDKYERYFNDNKINNTIIQLDKTLGECLNVLISKSISKFIIKIDDDDIYLSGLIETSIPFLSNNSVISTTRKHVYCPEKDLLYLRENNIGYGSLLLFNKYKIKYFQHISIGEDTIFLKNNQVKLLDLSNFHIHIRHEDTMYHSDKDEKYFNTMKCIKIDNNFKQIVKEHGLYELNNHNQNIEKKLKKTLCLKTNNNIKKLNIIGIFDEFLYNTFKDIFNIHLISPNDKILNNYSFFFCESCWNGNNGEWKYKINSKTVKTEVLDILKQCKKLNIPTIFFNKEDPVNFDSYIETAKHFDIIITTDTNCIKKYTDLTQSKIFVMPFTLNPLTINNIDRQNDNDNSFFAGSFTYSLSEERKQNTNILLDKLKTKDFILFDRSLNKLQRKEFYNNKYSLNIFHPKYNKYIHSAISHSDLLNVHLMTNWCGNLNTIKNSDTMFARRVLEASIMKNSLVTDYSQGVYKNFENSIYKLEDELKYDNNEDILLNQIKKQLGWRNVIKNYNSYNHFSNIFEQINIKDFENPFKQKNKISVICSTNRINNYSIILQNYNRQKYSNKELIIVFNLDMNSNIQNIINNNKNSNIIIKQIDEKETLGYCLNRAINLSNGNIISKFDDDDFYGENYLQDMYYSMIISNADLVGKCAHMVYALETKELWIKFYKINYENYTYQANKWNFICGGSLFFKKYIYEKCKFKESNTGEDCYFIEQVKNNNFTIYASDFFNYCYIRDKCENHTYKTDLKSFLGSKSIMINKYDKIPINLINI